MGLKCRFTVCGSMAQNKIHEPRAQTRARRASAMTRARLRARARKLLQARDDLAVAHAAAAAPHARTLHQPARSRRSACCWAGSKAARSGTNTLLWGSTCACCRTNLQWHQACPTTLFSVVSAKSECRIRGCYALGSVASVVRGRPPGCTTNNMQGANERKQLKQKHL